MIFFCCRCLLLCFIFLWEGIVSGLPTVLLLSCWFQIWRTHHNSWIFSLPVLCEWQYWKGKKSIHPVWLHCSLCVVLNVFFLVFDSNVIPKSSRFYLLEAQFWWSDVFVSIYCLLTFDLLFCLVPDTNVVKYKWIFDFQWITAVSIVSFCILNCFGCQALAAYY